VSGPPIDAAAAGITARTGGRAHSREMRRWKGRLYMVGLRWSALVVPAYYSCVELLLATGRTVPVKTFVDR
jgi:hypothetical protein